VTNLVRSEFRKIFTTNTWWLFLAGVVALTAASFALNALQAHAILHATPPRLAPGAPSAQQQQVQAVFAAETNIAVQAANLYTSGQYFGLLFVLLLGILVVTNEFFHQTATATFLVTPRRTWVIAGKLTATVASAAVLSLGIMALCVIAGVIFLRVDGDAIALTDPAVLRALALNLLGYCIWAVFGVGFGTLIRNQIAAIVVALALYLIASQVAAAIIQVIAFLTHATWVSKLAVVVPSVASQTMIAGGDIPGNPPQWLGAVVLLAYAVVAGAIGTLLTRSRDIG
jgi:ABC-type transport system involved in multi-copper enzyme maturation permease subunit